ncbi:ArsR/SmtB family transcription factor [Thermasporomyces composti]|jgi:DNA-binding transcriptional ArsR family regulator|uniref:DNA-binding transcriptional ArsR family regulator n=1 Tax=Thermasporomyces composti TaxID=696763 RepID=A0A3D9V6S2_THECX|nr:metalloregulator ArsR/SmtB family transcription factor [Thermasporomyces composti]REF37179.1 DNA-binding transcriptional ArsR family regulator [Thermasporomyces composti]
MTTPLPDLAIARPAPVLRVAEPSLAATVPTTMLLVDYALGLMAMPTPELQALAEHLPAEIVEESWPVRAAMAHGTVLRDVLMHHLPAGHPGHQEWTDLRRWLAEWSDEFTHGVIAWGVDAVMRYGKPQPDPKPTAADIAPLSQPSPAVRRDGVEVLRAWGVRNAEERLGELLDPRVFRAALLRLLDAIWDGWLDRAWRESLDEMRAVVAATPPPPPGCGGAQWISLVTGLRPDEQYAAEAERATELVVMPTPGLGRSLSLFTDQTTWVLFTPQHEPRTPERTTARLGPGRWVGTSERTGISVGRLGALAPAMHALGDRTRLAIVLHLLEHGPLTMQELAEALQVHQSTISRQVTALRKAEMVTVRRDRRVAVQRETIREACQTLLAALE